MRAVYRIFQILTVCLVILAMGPLSFAAESYPMVCKGGGEMKAEFSHVKDKGSFHNTSLVITFKKSPAAASATEPAPGHCAWVDRPISGEEPSSMAYSPGANQDFYFNFDGDRWSLKKTEDKGLEQILNAMRRGEKFYVRCSRDRTYFKVQSVGP